jgi:hypothetical protein
VDDVISCDRLRGGVSASCPATERILRAYLEYDGSFGESVFVVPTCGKNEYQTRTVLSGEIYEFSTRASDVCDEVTFTIYDSGDLTGANGDELQSSTVAIPCPGPWTIGGSPVNGFKLVYYVSTEDGGSTFNFNVLDAELEFEYIARNTGRTPLSATGGTIDVNPDGTSFYQGPVVAGGVIAQQNSQVLQTDRAMLSLQQPTGTAVSYELTVTGTSANSFAIPCEDRSTFVINL